MLHWSSVLNSIFLVIIFTQWMGAQDEPGDPPEPVPDERAEYCKELGEDLSWIEGDDSFGVCSSREGKAKRIEDGEAKLLEQDVKFFEEKNGSVLLQACSRTFFVTPNDLEWVDGNQECCQHGMETVKFESRDDLQCLITAMSEVNVFLPMWVGGLWRNCTFQWIDKSPINASLWAAHQPNREGEARCVSVNVDEVDASLSGLQDSRCATLLPVLCVKSD